jgi:hypothetical protein
MSKQGRLMSLIGLVFLILILLGGWWWVFTGDVETVLSTRELRGGWLLSPGGDKILYRSERQNVLMFLPTKQKNNIESCSGYTWLNNTNLVCSLFIIDTDDMVKVSIQNVKASEVNLDALLIEAGTIYKLEQYSDIVLLSANYKQNPDKNYWINEVKNTDQVLQGHSYVSVPPINYNPRRGGEKIYSPDRAYYYLFEGDTQGAFITIYDATNGELLSQSPRDGRLYQIGGWAADNSGVYFQLIPSGLGMFSNRSPLYKLRVP